MCWGGCWWWRRMRRGVVVVVFIGLGRVQGVEGVVEGVEMAGVWVGW